VGLAGGVLGFAGALVLGTTALLRCAPEPEGLDGLKPAVLLERSLAARAGDARAADVRIFFLGDSTTMQTPGRRNTAGSTMRELRRRAPDRDLRASTVASVGLDVFAYYALADRVARERPDVVVLALNLATFHEAPRVSQRPELAGWIEVDRWPETLRHLPLHWLGLTTDELLAYRAIVRAGGVEAWYRVREHQRRVGAAVRALEEAVEALAGGDPVGRLRRESAAEELRRIRLPDDPTRPSHLGVERLYGPVMEGLRPESPWVELWRLTIRRYAAGGARVIVYAVPVNVEHFERRGIPLGAGFQASLALLARVVREAGGEWLDLHDALPDGVFHDAVHFNEASTSHPTSAVGEALAVHILGGAGRD